MPRIFAALRRTRYRLALAVTAGLLFLGVTGMALRGKPDAAALSSPGKTGRGRPSSVTTSAPSIALQNLATGLPAISSIAHAGDSRIFLTYQRGQVAIWNGTQVVPTYFLDIDPQVRCCGEEGLLGLAFHPSYASNGSFFVYYTNNSGDNVVARYQRSAGDPNVADPSSGVILMTIAHPGQSNHNGGQLQFGPDGYLYIGPGDGGGGGDPMCNAQRTDTRLGKLLRIDVNVSTPPYWTSPSTNPFAGPGDPGLDEIWAIGLRNPWRFTFDRETGDLWIGDVGQGAREEIDMQPAQSGGGENYGWKIMEGTSCFSTAACPPTVPVCNSPALRLPVIEYTHAGGDCSVTGGYLYRGTQVSQLFGVYVYGDYCTGNIWGGSQLFTPTAPGLSTFGEDFAGELYLGTVGGRFARIVDANPSTPTPTQTPTLASPTPTTTPLPATATPSPPTPTATPAPATPTPSSAAPLISSIAPASGQMRGGALVTIRGANFAPGASVAFGGVETTDVSVLDSLTLTAVTGPHTAGLVDVVVTNPGGLSSVMPNGYRYEPPARFVRPLPSPRALTPRPAQ